MLIRDKSFDNYINNLYGTNKKRRRKMYNIIIRIMNNELSDRQKECLSYRMQGFKLKEISQILKIDISSVSKHIQKGITRIKTIVGYLLSDINILDE